MNLHWYVIITPSPQSMLGSTLGVMKVKVLAAQSCLSLCDPLDCSPLAAIQSMNFDQHVMTSIHPYSITENSLTVFRIIWALPHHSSFPQPLATTAVFTISLVLPFLKYHIVEISCYAAFSDTPLSLRSSRLHFLHICSWLDSSLLFSVE